MKNILLLALMACLCFSCSKEADLITEDEKFMLDQYPQKWQLVSMSGNIANVKPLTGTNMPWQEHYLLNADGSFKKHREENGTITEASGTFKLERLGADDRTFLVLAYEAPSPIIGTCSPDLKETLGIRSSEELHNSWSACDGPGLTYKRVKYEAPVKIGN